MEKRKWAKCVNLPARAGAFYTLSTLISRGTAFAFTPIFTRILTPEEYGVYFLYSGWLTVLSVIASPELAGSTAYRGLADFGENFLPSAFCATATHTSLFLAFYIIFRRWINGITTLSTPIMLILILQVLANSLEGLCFARERYKYRYTPLTLINVGHGILAPILSIAIIKLTSIRGEARIISELLVSLAFVIPQLASSLRRSHRFMSCAYKYALTVCLSLLPSHLSRAIIGQSGRLLTSRLLGAAALGRYSVASSTGFMISLAFGGLSLGLAPWIARKKAADEGEKIKKTLFAVCLLVCLATLAFLCFAPEIFAFVAPREYGAALPCVYPLALAAATSFSAGIFTSVLLYSKRIFEVSLVSGISAATAILLGYFLIRLGGIFGGAVSCAVAYTTSALGLYIVAKRRNEPLPSFADSLRLLLLLFLFAPLTFVLRHALSARLLLCLAVMAVAIRHRRTFTSLIGERRARAGGSV